MEITRNNFDDEFENITNNLKRSCFIGFDAEFTAILAGECFKHRLFDTNEERYDKLKTKAGQMIMSQIGLTLFCYDRDVDTYVATGYTFHLCPQAFGDIDQSLIFQASTLKFLCKHKFNYNKFTYEGLPYLSKSEEATILQQMKDQTLLDNITRGLEIADEKELQKQCSEVSKWLASDKEETFYLDIENPILRYLIHNELRLRFPSVLTTNSLGNSKKVLIYRDKNVQGAYSTAMNKLEEDLMNHVLGFSRVISLLEKYPKPITGHNTFLDIVLLHSQFIGPLPNSYSTFKSNINSIFPTIFDTKLISHEMGRKLPFDVVWKSNILQNLYEFFSEGKCKQLEKSVNQIKLTTPFDVKQTYHEAGWDSYCSGYCLIRLGHWAACENSGSQRSVGPTEIIASLNRYCNKINVIRGAVPYMNLVGDDPPKHRPPLLHIKSLREKINVGQVASLLANFGNIDVKPYCSKTALIAANTHQIADKIMKQFRDSRDYKICKYSSYSHTLTSRMALWSGVFVTSGLLFYLIQKD